MPLPTTGYAFKVSTFHYFAVESLPADDIADFLLPVTVKIVATLEYACCHIVTTQLDSELHRSSQSADLSRLAVKWHLQFVLAVSLLV
eukprot:6172632-Pleurochrysis_carterae.AAC.3